jgi:rhodanese-related sulfurtransferase
MSAKFKLVIILFTTILSLSCNTKQQSKSQEKELSAIVVNPVEFKEKSINQVVVDVRTPDEYSEGHIEGAVNVNYFDSNFSEQISKFEKTKPIFVYCRSGKRSTSAASKLIELGYNQVYNLEGGILNWASNNFQIIE